MFENYENIDEKVWNFGGNIELLKQNDINYNLILKNSLFIYFK